MTVIPIDLSAARILVSNDDGIEAPGIKVLERNAAALSDAVWVVAPETEQSGTAHSLTLRPPLRLPPVGGRCDVAHGTPAAGVRLATDVLATQERTSEGARKGHKH